MPLSGYVREEGECKIFHLHISCSGSHGVEGGNFQHVWAELSMNAFPPFSLLQQILSKLLLSRNLSVTLVTPLWPQKEWYPDLLALLVREPVELHMLWNLLVQLHSFRVIAKYLIISCYEGFGDGPLVPPEITDR